MNGSQHEPLPILTVAKELNVDSIEGFIYWSTGHAVECARLNGKQRKTYYPAELFSGKQGMLGFYSYVFILNNYVFLFIFEDWLNLFEIAVIFWFIKKLTGKICFLLKISLLANIWARN